MNLRRTSIAAVVLVLSLATPAAAFHGLPFTVVDRNAVSLAYLPFSTAESDFTFSLSYRLDPAWDLLAGYSSHSFAGGTGNGFRIGGRYHLRPPARGIDTFATVQYKSVTTAGVSNTGFLGGLGISAELAPRLDGFGTISYDSLGASLFADYGLKYQIGPQYSVVAGVNNTFAYLAVEWAFPR